MRVAGEHDGVVDAVVVEEVEEASAGGAVAVPLVEISWFGVSFF